MNVEKVLMIYPTHIFLVDLLHEILDIIHWMTLLGHLMYNSHSFLHQLTSDELKLPMMLLLVIYY